MLTGAAVVFRLAAISHVVLVLALLARDRRSDRSARATGAFLLAVIGYLGVPLGLHFEIHQAWLVPLLLAAFSAPFAFWWLARVHFDDETNMGRWPVILWIALIATTATSYLTGPLAPSLTAVLRDQPQHIFWMFVSKALGGALVLHALYRVFVGARSDLVELRLKLRYLFLAVAGGYVLLVIVAEAALHQSPLEAQADAVNAGAIWALALIFSFSFTSIGSRFLKETQPDVERVSAELLERFHRVVEGEKAYREPGVTIRKLALRLTAYEHRVRALINSHLGFKNFNAFVNHFRIQDARAMLEDPAQDERSIADIAFELGYQSLGPFNKAFKEITGRTPREFRKSRETRLETD